MKTRSFTDSYGFTWIYQCGWRIVGTHPYRSHVGGEQIISQAIGLLEFRAETGVIPTPKTLPGK